MDIFATTSTLSRPYPTKCSFKRTYVFMKNLTPLRTINKYSYHVIMNKITPLSNKKSTNANTMSGLMDLENQPRRSWVERKMMAKKYADGCCCRGRGCNPDLKSITANVICTCPCRCAWHKSRKIRRRMGMIVAVLCHSLTSFPTRSAISALNLWGRWCHQWLNESPVRWSALR